MNPFSGYIGLDKAKPGLLVGYAKGTQFVSRNGDRGEGWLDVPEEHRHAAYLGDGWLPVRVVADDAVAVQPSTSGADDNDARAALVAPFVAAYRQAYYGRGFQNEPVGMVITDMLANLYHLADRTEDDREAGENLGADSAHDRAMVHYVEESEEDS